MMALLEALSANASSLKEVYVHDNWIKGEAVDSLVRFILKAQKLERLNISDSTMGTAGAVLVARALQEATAIHSTLKSFSCNYNEVETYKASRLILDTLLNESFSALESVEYKGNSLGLKTASEYVAKFSEKGCKLIVFEEDDEEDGEGEDEEEDDSDGGFDEEDIVARLEKLKL
jgi:Ran GTPase-activating protein (RanGAP) involved in mRNA processing and transport